MNRVSGYVLVALTRIVADVPLFGMMFWLYLQREGTGKTSDAMFNAVVFVTFGVLHSLLARDWAKRHIARLVGEDYVRIFYVWLAGITLAIVLLLWRPISGELWHASGILYWVLSILYFGCVVGMVYSATFIDYMDFLGVRALLRRLKNRPAKPPVFSAQGLYAYCRHPMYLFLLFSFWVGPVMTYGRLEFATLGSVYLIFGTFLEERNLRKELGKVYDLYRANVPMWIPRRRPWRYE